MPLPASGQISLKDILEEKNITYVSAIQRIRLKGLSVDGSAISEADPIRPTGICDKN